MQMKQPTATVRPFNAAIGAEIEGLDVSKGLTAAECSVVTTALDRYGVIVLHNQDVSPSSQKALAQGIGTLRPLVYGRYSLPGNAEVMIVSNIKKDGQDIGISDAGSLWHSDGAYLREPDMYSLLYGIEIPHRFGEPIGDTVFASVTNAYDDLPADLKTRLSRMTCTNSFEFHLQKKASLGQLRRAPLTPEQKAATPDVVQPVVRKHPNTGHPCLYVNEAHTKALNGVTPVESDALLAMLWKHIVSPKYLYRHRWRAGDLIIWDNCAVQHLAVFDYGDIPRRLHRTGTFGPVPIAY